MRSPAKAQWGELSVVLTASGLACGLGEVCGRGTLDNIVFGEQRAGTPRRGLKRTSPPPMLNLLGLAAHSDSGAKPGGKNPKP